MTFSFVRPVCLLLLSAAMAAAVEPGQPSRTALAAVVRRATGSRDPNPKLRNPDYFAEKFIGPQERESFKAALLMLPSTKKEVFALDWDSMVLRTSNGGNVYYHTARTKYFDEAFEQALRDGVRQVVILGAGFDSRGYRFQKELGATRFFEVDYGPTQEYKKRRLKEILGSVPEHVRFVPVDFTKEDLLTQLTQSGYSEKEKSFFLWEGVTTYLPEAAVKETLRFIRNHSGAGSLLAFNYSLDRDPVLNNPRTSYAIWGEPRIFGLPEHGAAAFLGKEGLETVSDVGLKELLSKYEFPPTGLTNEGRFCLARVPGASGTPGSTR